jgi:hypothetical protein
MHEGMAVPVRLPDHSADRPRPLGLFVVGFFALSAGLGLARELRKLDPGTPVPTAPQLVAAQGDDAAKARTLPDLPPPSTSVNAVVAAGSAPPEAAHAELPPDDAHEAAAEPSEAAASVPTQNELAVTQPAPVNSAPEPDAPSFELGIVAYDRCDGLPLLPGRFPCPRDLRLEQHVWHALRALERCDAAQGQHGSGELRMEFERDRLVSLRLARPKRGRLNREIVNKCAGAALSLARTSLLPERMLVRFRFELR